MVRRQPPATAQQAEPAAERLAADPDRGAAAGRDRDFVLGQGGVEVAEPEAGPHGRRTVRDLEEFIGPRSRTIPGPDERPAKSWPPLRTATAIRERRAKASASATSSGVRHSTTACGRIVEARDLGPANLVVSRGAGKDDLSLHSCRQVSQSGLNGGYVTLSAHLLSLDRAAALGASWAEELDRVARWILDEDLAAARSLGDLTTEPRP